MFVRRLAAVWAGRFVGWLSRLVRIGGGTAVSGLVSITIDPSFVVVNLRGLASSVAITGTNGKTTTTAVLSHLLETDGRAVLSNPTGSNLERGLAAAMLPRLTWDGRTRGFKDLHGVFEVDEAAFAALMPDSSPTIAVFLNLFRDQLDRYGEVDHTATAWASAVTQLDRRSTLVANADDPTIVAVARRHRGRVIFFGLDVDGLQATPDAWADAKRCPLCGGRLNWSRVVYAHLGCYTCSRCEFCRPAPDVRVTTFQSRGLKGSDFVVVTPELESRITTRLPGIYNAYNVAAAVAAGLAQGINLEGIARAVEMVDPAFGRAETIDTSQTEILLLLVKNPAGANQSLELLRPTVSSLDMLMLLNDGVADGQDVSWIWDVDFDGLAPRRIVVGGRRGQDLALRLKYAGVAPQRGILEVESDIEAALDVGLAGTPRRLVILATYTAMLEVRKVCVRRGWVQPYWQDVA